MATQNGSVIESKCTYAPHLHADDDVGNRNEPLPDNETMAGTSRDMRADRDGAFL